MHPGLQELVIWEDRHEHAAAFAELRHALPPRLRYRVITVGTGSPAAVAAFNGAPQASAPAAQSSPAQSSAVQPGARVSGYVQGSVGRGQGHRKQGAG